MLPCVPDMACKTTTHGSMRNPRGWIWLAYWGLSNHVLEQSAQHGGGCHVLGQFSGLVILGTSWQGPHHASALYLPPAMKCASCQRVLWLRSAYRDKMA